MMKTRGKKWLSVVLTIIMVFSLIPAFAFASTEEKQELTCSDYITFLSDLKVLEKYADMYTNEHSGEDPVALVINYIRCGVEKYTSGTWTTFCGEEKTAFTNYVADQDKLNGTTAGNLRALDEFTLPNGDQVEFAHMFGCMDMSYHTGNRNTADLGSWAGDICDLIQLTTNAGVTGTVEEMAEEIRTNNDKYFLHDDPEIHSFGRLDLYGDLDAFYILNKIDGTNSISAIMENYFTENLNDCIRVKYFLDNRFPNIRTKDDIRNEVFETYCANEGLKTLEGTYVPEGVNADLRKACCYAFADYLYETAEERLNNPYYKVFSSEKSTLAPGIKQEVKMALTKDSKQIVYYLAMADITRSDVSIYANYNNNDGSAWKMARVTDQMKAAQEKHTDSSNEAKYIPNYSAVVGVNADFYNMSNGCPSGALVMEGVEYHGVGSENFFGILKDGTPIIGGGAEWNENKADIQEAVGASMWLVKNGKIAVNTTDNYYTDRVSRTCVGITYDGQVVLMVLDGRQEPFSAGGSAIEIAQIMLDAGCISAVNLDGGGSSTFAAKGEGSEEIEIVNRPSDGYERSVSSSLLVVSTAKPSNVFDHAIISADYDYLTVGTDLEISTTGVTSTGGAIALPENSTLRVSDSSKGDLSAENVFTAKALGDVQIQLVAEDGSILGNKTLHIVEPTDLKFTKDRMNAIYAQAEELPLQASYNGNPVKINPNDVQFGFMKITLESIGEIEGGTVNTTKTELVFEYPEAGEISDFGFTGNEEGGLRTVTIGAVLKNKFEEFQNVINQEFVKAFQEAKGKGYSDAEAELQAQAAAINKALDTATKITVYLYKNDEANFDFNQATGNNGLLAWKREVSNTEYKSDRQTYYMIDPTKDMEVSYSFAVDMSKVPIPEKLTGLLYMLPGGDQEGRTAWDFLLQLAERISPLTTVSISLTVPDGFTVNTENLRIANEYFTLTSAEVEGNTLNITCNYVEQSEPINPTTANPICVLTGIKLIPTDEAAWDSDNYLAFTASGKIDYDIYAHFHILKTLAEQKEYQEQYGLYPYDNSDNLAGDYGAHFFNSITDFEDTFKLNRNGKNGWVRENGNWSFYQNGSVLTGIQELPSYESDEEGTFWFDLGSDGVCIGKLTGLFEVDNNLFYAVNGKKQTGWRAVESADGESNYYYFDPNTQQAVDGECEIDKLNYTFNNHILVRGALVTDSKGIRYYWAGEPVKRKWCTIDGNRYYFEWDYYALTGLQWVGRANSGQGADLYLFGDDGVLVTTPGLTFVDNENKDIVFLDENGMATYAGLVQDSDGNYYYINGDLKAVKNGLYWVTKTNGLMKSGLQREFDAEGRMIVKNGIYKTDSGLVYYLNDDMQVDTGLTRMPDGRYIFVNSWGNLYVNCKKTIPENKTNGLLPAGEYTFDSNGILQLTGWYTEPDGITYYKDGVKHATGWDEIDHNFYYFDENSYIVTETQRVPYPNSSVLPGYGPDAEDADVNREDNPNNPDGYIYPDSKTALFVFDENGVFQKDKCGLYDDDDATRWIQNGQVIWHAGLVMDGDDYRYFKRNGMVADVETYVAKTNGLLPAAKYTFDNDGKLKKLEGLHDDLNGDLCYYVNYVKNYAGLVQDSKGNYYYIASDLKAVKNCTYYVTKTNDLKNAGYYAFDEEGKMIIKNGLTEENGDLYYYEDGAKVAKGLVQDSEGNYYYIASSLKAVKNEKHYVSEDKSNGYKPAGWYWFDEDGKMFLEGLHEDDEGQCYYYKDGVKTYAGLIQIEGSYYYVKSDCSVVCGRSYYVTKTNGLVPAATYEFAADGKMILKNGIYREKLGDDQEYLFYYIDNVRQVGIGLMKLEDGSYIYVRSGGNLAVGEYYVTNNNGLLPSGTYTFGDDGRISMTEQ